MALAGVPIEFSVSISACNSSFRGSNKHYILEVMILRKTGLLNVLLGHKGTYSSLRIHRQLIVAGEEKKIFFLGTVTSEIPILLLIIRHPNKTKFSCKQY